MNLNLPYATTRLDGDRLVVTAADGYTFGFTHDARRDYWQIDDPWIGGEPAPFRAAHFGLRHQADRLLNGDAA